MTDSAHDVQAVREYVRRRFAIEAELAELRQSLKDLDEEFKERKVDVATLKKVISAARIRMKVPCSPETFDELVDIVESESSVHS